MRHPATGNDMVGAWKPGNSDKVIMIHPATVNDMVGAWKPGDSNKVGCLMITLLLLPGFHAPPCRSLSLDCS